MPTSYSFEDWAILSAYIIAGFIGTFGNGFIIRTIRKRKMDTTTFSLIANQAFSDMSCGISYLSLWFFCSAKMLSFGLSGTIICDLVLSFKTGTFVVSSLTMTTISIERYIKLYHPHNRNLTPTRAIVMIWSVALFTVVVAMFHFRSSVFFTETNLIGCHNAYETDIPIFKAHYNYIVALLFACFLPITITATMYYFVIKKIKTSHIGDKVSEQQIEAYKESKRQTTKMLIIIVVVYFTVCSPLFLLWFVHFFIVDILAEPCIASTEEPLYYRLAYLLCVTSICVNPFIYCRYNQVFKSEAKHFFRKLLCRNKEGSTNAGRTRKFVSKSESSTLVDNFPAVNSSSSSRAVPNQYVVSR